MKTKEGSNMDDLLVKQLLGETTKREEQDIAVWLQDSPENQRYFEHFDLIWKQSKQLMKHSTVDENAAWERFRQRVDEGKYEGKEIPLLRNTRIGFWRIAAVFIVLAGVGWAFYLYSLRGNVGKQIVKRSESSPLVVTLPDQSVVTLNRNSSLTFPEEFKGDQRPVTLQGEAFFEVTADKTKPFIISVNDVTVRVVGTSFNIKENSKKTEVIVETGLVEVANTQQKIKVKPHEQVTVLKDKPELVKQRSEDEFYNYYRTKKLVCDDTPLWRLVEILNEVYQADITIENEALKTMPINTTFDNQTLDEVLALISDTINAKVSHEGKKIILK